MMNSSDSEIDSNEEDNTEQFDPKQEKKDVLASLTQALNKCKIHRVARDAISKLIQEVTTIYIEKTPLDGNIIDAVDACISKYCKGEPITKYNRIRDALLSDQIYGVILSVNGACYIFGTERGFDTFNASFAQAVAYKGNKLLHLFNIYHITPPNAQQNARLQYKSVNRSELDLVKKRLAVLSGTPESSIEVRTTDEEKSIIIFSNKVGTFKEMTGEAARYSLSLLQEHKDPKSNIMTATLDGVECIADKIVVKKCQQLVVHKHYTIENNGVMIGNNKGTVNYTIGGVGAYKKKEGMKYKYSNAKIWVKENPPKTKQQTTDYHNKYVKAMKKNGIQHLGIRDFSRNVEELGFIKERRSGQIFWREADSDDSSDNSNSEDETQQCKVMDELSDIE